MAGCWVQFEGRVIRVSWWVRNRVDENKRQASREGANPNLSKQKPVAVSPEVKRTREAIWEGDLRPDGDTRSEVPIWIQFLRVGGAPFGPWFTQSYQEEC